MERKILFTHSYFLRFDPKQWKTGQPYPPLGTLYAASLMRENQCSVSFFDTMFSKSPEEILPALQHHRPEFLVLYDDGFNYLTKMCLTNMREAAFRMIKLGKQAGCKVIVSSSDSTDHFQQYISEGADFVIIGEAELTLLELINAISTGTDDLSHIAGIAYNNNGSITRTVKRNVMRDLDALPLPAWDLVDIQPYRKMWMNSTGYFSLNMGTTRGCPFKCNWCAKPIYGNRYNVRSPQNVVKELLFLKSRFGFDHIWFCDDIFGLKPGWVKSFADLVQQNNLELKFKIQARADLLLQDDHIADLARAGCDNVWMGAESGSQRILDAMDKGTRIEQIYTATRLLKKHNIKPSFFIQFGYPGETHEDIEKTISMINELLPAELGISVSYPLPGTVFYEKVKMELKEKSNWTDSDELQLMFRNTYSPEFYKQLHRFVHKSYRRHTATNAWKEMLQHPASISQKQLKKAASLAYYLPAEYVAKRKLEKLEKK